MCRTSQEEFADVRFGSEAAVVRSSWDVRFAPGNGH